MKNRIPKTLELNLTPKVAEGDTALIEKLKKFEHRDYTVMMPITLSLDLWSYIELAAGKRKVSMAALVTEVLENTDTFNEIVADGVTEKL